MYRLLQRSVVWVVVIAEVVVPYLTVKLQTRQRATSRRLRTEFPEVEVKNRIVLIVAASTRKTTRKGKIKTLGSTIIAICRDLFNQTLQKNAVDKYGLPSA